MKRLAEIEGIRGILALWVVLDHCLGASGYEPHELKSYPLLRLIREGWYAVDVFIIISGFVIAYLLYFKQESFTAFLSRRFFRLYPLYIFLIIAGFFSIDLWLENNSYAADWHSTEFVERTTANLTAQKNNFLAYFLPCMVMLQGVIPENILSDAPSAFLGTSWSISLEWQFYIAAGLILPGLMLKKQPAYLVFCVIAGVFLFKYLSFSYLSDLHRRPFLPFYIEYFFFGILSFLAYTKLDESHSHRLGRHFLLLSSSIVIILYFSLSSGDFSFVPFVIWSVLFFSIIDNHLNTETSTNVFSRLLNNRIFQYLGKISYSIYLSHWIVIIILQNLIFKFFPYFSMRDHLIVLTSSTLLLTLVASHLLYYSIESTGVKIGNRLIGSWSTQKTR